MSALQGTSLEVAQATVRPLNDITRELEKSSKNLSSGDITDGQKTSVAHLEKVACDLKVSLMEPIGSFASKTVSLMARLRNLAERADEEMKPSRDMSALQRTLDEMAADTLQLQRGINGALSATSPTERESLMLLAGLGKEADRIRDMIEYIQDNVEIIQDNAVLIEKNKNLTQRISELRTRILNKA